MNRKWLVTMLAAVLSLGLCACEDSDDGDAGDDLPPATVNVTGVWTLSFCDTESTASFDQSGNAVRGTASYGGQTADVVGTVSGDTFAFSLVIPSGPDLVASATVSGDTMGGTIAGGGQECTLTGTRQ